MTDYTDLSRFDSEVLAGIVYEHQRQIEWYERDITRIIEELNRRNAQVQS